MSDANVLRPDLTEAEWKVIAELLRQELSNLPAEIHHTDSRDYRDHLYERREAVSHALQKVEAVLRG